MAGSGGPLEVEVRILVEVEVRLSVIEDVISDLADQKSELCVKRVLERQTYIRSDLELFDEGVVGSFRILAEKVLVKHCFNFVFSSTGLLVEVLSLAELAEYFEGSAFGGASTTIVISGVARAWRQIMRVLGFSQFGKKHLL